MAVDTTTSQKLWTLSFPSDLGWMALLWADDALLRLVFGCTSDAEARQRLDCRSPTRQPVPGELRKLAERLQRFASGMPDAFQDVPVNHRGRTAFQRAVLEQCRQIPVGTVVTYSQLAARVGHPRSARAVGNVMAGNRVPLVVPCHRVVASGGRLGGFSAPDGTDMKRRLLELEAGTPIGVAGP